MPVLRSRPDSKAPPKSAGGKRTDESGAFRAKPRVMVVDDDARMARQLALALELEGVETAMAVDGDQAIAALREMESDAAIAAPAPDQVPVDLVLIELMLPRRSGLELARELGARYPELRIVLTGAYHLSERQLARAGCNAIAFVPKPCQPSVVAAFVRRKVAKIE